MIVLRCIGCQNQVIVTNGCSGYCDKCKIQLQYDCRLTKELCGKDNEKEKKMLEKLAKKEKLNKKKKVKSKIKSKHKKKKL